MNFDTTHIAIRERNFAEIMDLALHVIRAHAGPLAIALVIGAAPWGVLNWLLLGGLLEETLWEEPFWYAYWLVMLVAVETPLATAPMTLYLGQVTFADRVDARRIASDLVRSLPQMLLSQVLIRAVCVPMVVTLLLPYASWPYLSELILLERNPMFAGRAKGGAARLSTNKRSKNLHRHSGGDLFARWAVSTLAGALLIAVLVGGLHTLADQLFSTTLSTRQNLLYTLPAMIWLVVGYFAVVRFLAYLDIRIRREGWEVELTMRAEAARLARTA